MRLWQVFLSFEFVLLMWLGFQIVTNPPALVAILFAVLFLFTAKRFQFGREFNRVIGGLLLGIGIFINPAAWLVLLFGGIFVIVSVSNTSRNFWPWAKKQYVAPVAERPAAKSGQRILRTWNKQSTIRPNYDWDDINLVVAAGDTLIDLGETFLPKGDNVIVIRKGFGTTRILVPIGVGIMVDQSAFFGQLRFEDQVTQLHGQSITAYSANYDEAPRRIHIITNVGVGDVEVQAI